MRNLSYSFKPDGHWFVFNVDTGETVPCTRPDGQPLVMKTARKARMEWIRQRGV